MLCRCIPLGAQPSLPWGPTLPPSLPILPLTGPAQTRGRHTRPPSPGAPAAGRDGMRRQVGRVRHARTAGNGEGSRREPRAGASSRTGNRGSNKTCQARLHVLLILLVVDGGHHGAAGQHTRKNRRSLGRAGSASAAGGRACGGQPTPRARSAATWATRLTPRRGQTPGPGHREMRARAAGNGAQGCPIWCEAGGGAGGGAGRQPQAANPAARPHPSAFRQPRSRRAAGSALQGPPCPARAARPKLRGP